MPRRSWGRFSPAVDVDGDGCNDFLVAHLGAVRAVSAVADVIHRVPDAWGHSFTGLGDVDRDGFGEFVIADPLATDSCGVVRVLSGRDGKEMYRLQGDDPEDSFGWTVAAAGDVDGDGVPDLVAGTNADAGQYARVFSGKDGSGIHTLREGGERSSECVVAGAGDADDDGHADVVVSFIDADWMQGAVVVLFSGAEGDVLWHVRSEQYGFGRELDAAGDIDADGHTDVVVGAWDSVVVYSGQDGSLIRTIPDAWFAPGHADLDNDGHADLLITRNTRDVRPGKSDDSIWREGRVEVLSGKDGSVLLQIAGGDLD